MGNGGNPAAGGTSSLLPLAGPSTGPGLSGQAANPAASPTARMLPQNDIDGEDLGVSGAVSNPHPAKSVDVQSLRLKEYTKSSRCWETLEQSLVEVVTEAIAQLQRHDAKNHMLSKEFRKVLEERCDRLCSILSVEQSSFSDLAIAPWQLKADGSVDLDALDVKPTDREGGGGISAFTSESVLIQECLGSVDSLGCQQTTLLCFAFRSLSLNLPLRLTELHLLSSVDASGPAIVSRFLPCHSSC